MGVAEAARSLGLAANTVSTLVGRLTVAGLIERTDDPADRRAAVLCPPLPAGPASSGGARNRPTC